MFFFKLYKRWLLSWSRYYYLLLVVVVVVCPFTPRRGIGPYYLLLINPKVLYLVQIRYWTHS
jgi:hypothetical protein